MPPDAIDLIPFFGFRGLEDPRSFGILMAAVTAADLIAASAVLALSVRGQGEAPGVGLAAVARVAFVLAGMFVAKAVFLPAFGVGAFGLITALWYDGLIVAPALAGAVLAGQRRGWRVSPAARVAVAAALAFLPVALYARWIEPFRLRVERVEIATDPARRGPEPLRVAVLADLQVDRVGPWEESVIDRVRSLDADVILIPGDLYHGSLRHFERVAADLRRLLGQLEAPGGVYLTQGDVDADPILEALLPGTGIRWLRDETATVTVRGRQVTIAGLCRELGASARRVLSDLESRPGDDLRIVLCHYPRVVRLLRASSRIDLCVAGHTHGGQVVIPFLGPPITLSPMPRRVAKGGLDEESGRRIYVSRGIGLERMQAPRIRFLCPPELTLLEFE